MDRPCGARVAALLDASPLVSESVAADIRDLVSHGEEGLAFDTMCSWLYEDAVPITREYHARLAELAGELGTPGSVRRLDELLTGP